MATSKLALYNAAAALLGERKLSSLAENVTMRRRLDSAWDDDFIRKVLAQGLWNCAMREIELSYSPSITPAFGYRYAFDKPTDWVRSAILSESENFNHAMRAYEDQGAYWFCDLDTIWVRYVSDGLTNGADLSMWTPGLVTFAEHHLAWKVARITTGSKTDAQDLEVSQRRMLIQARATDAMDEATRTLPLGSWTGARRGTSER
jgi:hypothetical protein